MSSMSPPPQRPAQPPYPPNSYQGAPPAPSSYGQPPAKRQRLSPDPRSPPSSTLKVSFAPIEQPQAEGQAPSAYGNPYAQQPSQSGNSSLNYTNSPQNSFHSPQPFPYQQVPWQSQQSAQGAAGGSVPNSARQGSPPSQLSREMMPPPPRPNREDRDERAGVEEIGDSLYGSGINLKDEENYMHTVYNNRHAGESFTSNQHTSFGSNVITPSNSFNIVAQQSPFGSQDTKAAFVGTFGQPQSQEEIELEDRRRREAASNARAERTQHHLNNPFLLCNIVRTRLEATARNHGVMLNTTGISTRQPETNVMVNGAHSTGIVSIHDRPNAVKLEQKPETIVSQGVPFEHLLSLLSLAAGERVRGLVDDSFALARARRYGDHGRVVPPEFSNIADGEGTAVDETLTPENITGSQWDKTVAQPSKDSEAQADEGDGSTKWQPQQTVVFQGNLGACLRELAERDRQAETERLKRRENRKRAADATANGEGNGTDTPASDTPMANGVEEAAAPLKISKKEQAKQQKEKSTLEAQTHNTVNQTAAMMALGRKKNRYSWMSGGAANLPTNRFAKPNSSAVSTPTGMNEEARSPVPSATPMENNNTVESGQPKWGDWREDRVHGKGVQLRDWVLVLERDGREKKALQTAFLKLS